MPGPATAEKEQQATRPVTTPLVRERAVSPGAAQGAPVGVPLYLQPPQSSTAIETPMLSMGAAAAGPAGATLQREAINDVAPADSARVPIWVEFSRDGAWDAATVLQNLKSLTQVSAELEMAIQAGPLATAKLCVRLRHEVEARAGTEPAKRDEYRTIGNALFSRINELVHATSHSPLQYRQLAAVAEWWNAFRPPATAVAAPIQSQETSSVPEKADRGTFASAYSTNGRLVASAIGPTGESFEQFKARQGPLVSTSDTTTELQRARNPLARKVLVELDGDDLIEIYERKVAKANEDKAAWAQTNEKLKGEMPRINAAFRMMMLDTSGAQAHYLANAYMESSMLQFMTETGKAGGDEAFREGGDAKLDTSWLEDAKDGLITKGTKDPLKVTGYQPGGTINKVGTRTEDHWEQSFLGRGPIQVTHDWGYLQTLAVMDARLDELEAMPPGAPARGEIPLLAEALRAIKADPRMAADRRYAYLFSAASRKRRMATKDDPVGTRLDSQVVSSSSPATAGMGDHSQLPESAKRKAQIFDNAIRVINRKNPKPG